MRNSETILNEIQEIESKLQMMNSDENGNIIDMDAASPLINELDALETELWEAIKTEKNKLRSELRVSKYAHGIHQLNIYRGDAQIAVYASMFGESIEDFKTRISTDLFITSNNITF